MVDRHLNINTRLIKLRYPYMDERNKKEVFIQEESESELCLNILHNADYPLLDARAIYVQCG